MRISLFFIVAALAFSGCLDDDSSADTPDNGTPTEDGNMTMQAPLQFTGNMLSIAEPAGTGIVGVCQFPGSCAAHEFTVDADGTMVSLTLVSTDGTATGVTAQALYGSDYDLFVFDGANQIGSSTNPGEQDDLVEVTLNAGTYTAQVHAWNDVDGSYTLDIVFS